MKQSDKAAVSNRRTPTFSSIQAILNRLTVGRTPEHLKNKHSSESFGWQTKCELLAAEVVLPGATYRLIQPELIGVNRGTEANLYRVLSEEGLDGWNMPWQGNGADLWATPEELSEIAAWIDADCPD